MNDVAVLEKKSNDVVEQAKSYQIANQEQYESTANFLKGIKMLVKEVDEAFDTSIKNAHTTWKGLIAEKKKHIEPLENAEKLVKQKMIHYSYEQDKIRREEQRKADEEARKAEEKRKKELEEQAKKWEEKGNTEKAEERREQAEEVKVDAPIIPQKVEKVEGIKKRTVWKFKIIDVDKIPRSFLIPDEKMIGGVVRSTKGKKQIPGVKIFSEEILAV